MLNAVPSGVAIGGWCLYYTAAGRYLGAEQRSKSSHFVSDVGVSRPLLSSPASGNHSPPRTAQPDSTIRYDYTTRDSTAFRISLTWGNFGHQGVRIIEDGPERLVLLWRISELWAPDSRTIDMRSSPSTCSCRTRIQFLSTASRHQSVAGSCCTAAVASITPGSPMPILSSRQMHTIMYRCSNLRWRRFASN